MIVKANQIFLISGNRLQSCQHFHDAYAKLLRRSPCSVRFRIRVSNAQMLDQSRTQDRQPDAFVRHLFRSFPRRQNAHLGGKSVLTFVAKLDMTYCTVGWDELFFSKIRFL